MPVWDKDERDGRWGRCACAGALADRKRWRGEDSDRQHIHRDNMPRHNPHTHHSTVIFISPSQFKRLAKLQRRALRALFRWCDGTGPVFHQRTYSGIGWPLLKWKPTHIKWAKVFALRCECDACVCFVIKTHWPRSGASWCSLVGGVCMCIGRLTVYWNVIRMRLLLAVAIYVVCNIAWGLRLRSSIHFNISFSNF